MGPIQVVVQDGNNLVLEVTPTPDTTVILDRGIAGSAATVAVGTTTSLAPGNPATVTNVGTQYAAVLNFGIPTAGGIAAGGATTQVQYNLSGVLAGSANMTFNGTTLNVLSLTEATRPVVVQTDIGTAPNEIPLNQYLGNLAYQDARSIAGQVGVITGTATAPAITPATNTNTGIFFPATDTIAFAEGGVEAMRISNAANVGIGTSSPAAALHVASGNMRLTNGAGFTTANSLIREINSASGSANQFITSSIGFNTGNFSDAGVLTFSTANNASTPTERMRLDQVGNLGIGTSSPVGRLTVQGAAGTNGINQGIGLLYSNGTQFGALGLNNSSGWPQLMARAGAGLTFHVNSDLLTTGEAMRLDASGNLGIGTSSPATALEVVGASTTQFRLRMSGQADVRIISDTGYGALSLESNMPLLFRTNATERMRLDSSGNLGIGTSSPDGKLDVVAPALTAIFGSETAQNAYTGWKYNSTTVGYVGNGDGVVANGGASNFAIGATGARALVFGTNDTERMRLDASGNLIQSPPTTPPTLATNGQMVFNLTSNTNLRVSVRGSDGVTRTANITLA
jgi:hypothetical protein